MDPRTVSKIKRVKIMYMENSVQEYLAQKHYILCGNEANKIEVLSYYNIWIYV